MALVVRPAGLNELRKPKHTLYILRFPLYIISDVKVTLPVTLKFSLEILIYPQVIHEVIILGHFFCLGTIPLLLLQFSPEIYPTSREGCIAQTNFHRASGGCVPHQEATSLVHKIQSRVFVS